MRAAGLLESDPAAAARRAGDILSGSPGHEEAKLLLAAACRRLGDSATAIGVLESLSNAHGASSVLKLELGRAYAAAGRGAEARGALQRALQLDATLADAWQELAAQWFLVGDTLQGDIAYLKYLELKPDPPHLKDAKVAVGAGRLDAAAGLVRRHLLGAPRDVDALMLMGDIAARRLNLREAERCLTACLELAPGHAVARHDLAALLYDQERLVEALPHIERLLAAQPRNTDYRTLKARALRLIGRTAEALAIMEAIIADHPDDAQVWLVCGNLLRDVGDQVRTIEAYRRSIGAQRESGEAYWALANLKTFRFTDEDVEAMKQQLAQSRSLPDQTHLSFALGKALEDAGRFDESMEHYARGNALQRSTFDFDGAAMTAFVRRARALYTPEFFAQRAGWGSDRPDPIFIIGLPRSGSTLLEQILATHSQIEGTRELPDVPDMVLELTSRTLSGNDSEYPALIASLDRTEIDTLAARYLAQTQGRRPLGLPYFIDKMLANFSHIGLLHLMFPRAVFIDARRHPVGNGFSCYKQLFARGIKYSYNLVEFGRYYRDYADLMAHMDEVLPGRVHRVHYERLVADPATEVRRLLQHCRLPFEEACLRFHDNPRVVQTVSSEQVRLPIYAGAVDQWRHYEAWLKPLKDTVGDLVERYPVA
jgi:tetratricopeptide (TPR) repeat protein